MNKKVMFSSDSMEWRTPPEVFNKLNDEFHFTLDVASTDENALCEKHYTEKENGLEQSWQGETVWCNPPYGRQISKWVKKAYTEWTEGDSTIVLLIPSRTDTNYFHSYLYEKAELRFLKGRLHFLDECGVESDRAPFPSLVAVFRKRGRE